MTDYAPIPTSDPSDKRGHKARERRCVATGDVLDPSGLIRFVLSPDNVVTPDVFEKLPGRGTWVRSDRKSLETAVKTGGFHRGFKQKVTVPGDLVEMSAGLLEQRVLGLLSMAMKSGRLVLGFDQVKAAAGSGPLAWRIEASDGSPDGRSKIRVLTKAVSRELEEREPAVLGCFSAAVLGEALGRERTVHAALAPGKLARSLRIEAGRLSGFKDLVPTDWPDRQHETQRKTKRKASSSVM